MPRPGPDAAAGAARRRRSLGRLALVSAGLALAFAATWFGYRAYGADVVRAILDGRGPTALLRAIDPAPGEKPGRIVARVGASVRAALVLTALVWCFVATAWVLRALRVRLRLALPILALVWLAIERWGTPRIALGLRMRTWLVLQDPDHRPASTNVAQGWNEDSIRCLRQPDEFRDEDVNVVFLGDSFTFGFRLPAH